MYLFYSLLSRKALFTTWDGSHGLKVKKDELGIRAEGNSSACARGFFFPTQDRFTVLFWIRALPKVNFYLTEVLLYVFNFISYYLKT